MEFVLSCVQEFGISPCVLDLLECLCSDSYCCLLVPTPLHNFVPVPTPLLKQRHRNWGEVITKSLSPEMTNKL